MLRKFLLFAFLSTLTAPAFPLTPVNELQRLALRQKAVKAAAWKDPYWLKLLYYEKTVFGRTRSAAEDPGFFLAKWGAISPRLELEAAIDGLFFEGEPGDSPECRFPERYHWLREKFSLPVSAFPPPVCEELEEWKAGLDPESVSLLFAPGDLNSPQALYGDVLLRLHKRGAAGAAGDYAAGYLLPAGSGGGFLPALKSFAGSYPQKFSAVPYSAWLQEYRGTGNRDLWEFPLALAPEELGRLLRHAWELGKTSFPGRLFSRNASRRLLPLLEIAKPGLELPGRFCSWAPPSDAAKAVLAGFPAAAPAWRPSLWKTVEWKRSQLSESEKASVLSLARGGQPAELEKLETADPVRKAAVYEAAADYLNWRHQARLIGGSELENRSAPLLAALAPLEKRSVFAAGPPRPPSLLEAHESLRLGAGLVSLKNGPAYEIQGRIALQDLLDSPDYLPDSALETGAFRLRYEKRYNRFYIQEARLAHILSLTPWDDWTRRRSWEVSAGLEQAGETGRQSGRSAIWAMSAASGYSAEFDGPVRQLWYAMLQAESGFGPALNSNWRAGAGLKAGLLASKGPVRALVEARYIGYAAGDTRPLWAGSAGASLRLARNSSARLEYAWRGKVKEGGLYFHQFLLAP